MFQKIVNLGIYLIIFALPLYLVRFRIGWIPTNFLELLIIALFIVWLISKIWSGPFQFEPKNFFYPIFLIFLGLTLSTLFSVDLRTSAGIWKSWFIVPLLLFAVIVDSVKNRRQIKNILTALLLSGAGVSLLSLWYWLNNNLTYDGRLRAFYPSPNHLAMYLSPILILSFYLYFRLKKNIYKIFLSIAQCSLFIAVYLTYSWGAYLGIMAALLFMLLILWKLPRKLNFRIALASLLLIVLTASLQTASLKLPSLKSRLIIWRSAGAIIKDHPLLGVGPGMFQKYYLDYQSEFPPYLEWAVPQPHNIFLAFWLQAGLLGLIGFIWLLIQFFRRCWLRESLVSDRKISFRGADFHKFLMAAMIYLLIHGLVDATYWKNDLSVIFWLLISIASNRFTRLK